MIGDFSDSEIVTKQMPRCLLQSGTRLDATLAHLTLGKQPAPVVIPFQYTPPDTFLLSPLETNTWV